MSTPPGSPDYPDRSLSLTPCSVIDVSKPAVAVVDPCSTGAALAKDLAARGRPVICVWSDMCPEQLRAHTGNSAVQYAGVVAHNGDINKTAAAVRALGLPLGDVIVGCETGVLCADELAEALGVRGNGTAQSDLRRNKFNQTEAVRDAGLNAMHQVLASSSADVERFLEQHQPTPFSAVVKPVDGAGSQGVYICNSADDVRAAFAELQGTTNCLGLECREVLLQEYLKGHEYVVDTVSRDGVHKCTAIWMYDKRTFNGKPTVYFGMHLLAVEDEPHLAAMVQYTFGVLDAIGIRNGAVHAEVKAEARGPVLIEANCRLHGLDGLWIPIARAASGHDQVSALADSYLEPAKFEALPREPRALMAAGVCATVRSAVEGTISRVVDERIAQLRALPSFCDLFLPAELVVGAPMVKTVDVLTECGNVNLWHSEPAQLRRDYEAACAIIDQGLYEVAA